MRGRYNADDGSSVLRPVDQRGQASNGMVYLKSWSTTPAIVATVAGNEL